MDEDAPVFVVYHSKTGQTRWQAASKAAVRSDIGPMMAIGQAAGWPRPARGAVGGKDLADEIHQGGARHAQSRPNGARCIRTITPRLFASCIMNGWNAHCRGCREGFTASAPAPL
jgi:hypothetical protein